MAPLPIGRERFARNDILNCEEFGKSLQKVFLRKRKGDHIEQYISLLHITNFGINLKASCAYILRPSLKKSVR